ALDELEVLVVPGGGRASRDEAPLTRGRPGHEDRAGDDEPSVVRQDLQPRVAPPERPIVQAREGIEVVVLGGGDEERACGRLLVEREGLDLVQPGEREEARKLPGDRARS